MSNNIGIQSRGWRRMRSCVMCGPDGPTRPIVPSNLSFRYLLIKSSIVTKHRQNCIACRSQLTKRIATLHFCHHKLGDLVALIYPTDARLSTSHLISAQLPILSKRKWLRTSHYPLLSLACSANVTAKGPPRTVYY